MNKGEDILQPSKNETAAKMFLCEFGETFKNNLFTEHLWVTASKY